MTSFLYFCVQNLGIGILVAPLISFLESIAISKAFGKSVCTYVAHISLVL